MQPNIIFERQFFISQRLSVSFSRNEAGEIVQAVCLTTNAAFIRSSERASAELAGAPLASLFRNFHLITRKYFDSLHQVGQSFTVDLLMEPSHRPVTATVTLLDEAHFLLALENPTENQNTEAALLSIGEMWAFSLEGEGDGVWDWEIPQKTIHYSRRFKEILGIQMKALDFDDFDFKERLHPWM
jgi:PAS domain-containing protein